MTQKVTCVGTINWDVILDVDKVPDPDCSEEMSMLDEGVGGSATNTAVVLSEITEWDLNILGKVGNDKRGEKVKSILNDKGINPLIQNGGKTNLIYAIVTENADPRYFHKHLGHNSMELDQETIDSIENTDHIHVTSFSKETVEKLLRNISIDNKTISFNPTQGYSSTDFSDIMEKIDIAILNDREAEIFKERNNFDEFKNNKCLVVTHGAAGSTVYDKGETLNHSGYTTNKEVINTIGAGDSFTAGFLSKYLETNDHEKAIKYANATGALSTTRNGSMKTVSKEEIEKVID